MGLERLDRRLRYQAEIAGARRRRSRLRLEHPFDLMEIDLLAAEKERSRPAFLVVSSKTQGLLIEGASRVQRCHRQHEMIDPVDRRRLARLHERLHPAFSARTIRPAPAFG